VINACKQVQTTELAETTPTDVAVHIMFVDIHADAFRGSIANAVRRKAKFNKKVMEVIFKAGGLVQVLKRTATMGPRTNHFNGGPAPFKIKESFNNLYTVKPSKDSSYKD